MAPCCGSKGFLLYKVWPKKRQCTILLYPPLRGSIKVGEDLHVSAFRVPALLCCKADNLNNRFLPALTPVWRCSAVCSLLTTQTGFMYSGYASSLGFRLPAGITCLREKWRRRCSTTYAALTGSCPGCVLYESEIAQPYSAQRCVCSGSCVVKATCKARLATQKQRG